jgi:Holliday junction DNA helicase RuvB
MREEGLLATAQTPEDIEIEIGLRPRKLDEFVGQEALKERLAILIEAAAGRGESVDHLLCSGRSGGGNTSLAAFVAAEMGATFRST